MSKTGRLSFLVLAEPDKRPPYPVLNERVEAALRMVAEKLFLSYQSIAWAYHDGLQGDDDGWKRIRARLLSPKVNLVKGESNARK